MNKLGGWVIDVKENYPQKIATAISGGLEVLGCTYKPVAYLGYQEVNGINHAVLAEQTVINGRDSKNVVVLVLNEKPASMDVSLVRVVSVVESGGEFGGTSIELTTDIPEEALNLFDEVTEEFVGSKIDVVAFVGTQVTKGIDYKYIVTGQAVALNAEKKLGVATINSMDKNLHVEPLLNETSSNTLGYWIVKTSNGYRNLGAPLGEWP